MIAFLAFLAGYSALRYWAESRPAPTSQLLRVVWFVAITTYEWTLLRDKDWLPEFLGGRGDDAILHQAWDPDLSMLYQLQLAYHLQSMLFSLWQGAKAEMHVHHAITVLLVTISLAFGYLRFGTVVFFVHDVPDISGYLMKAAVEAQAKKVLMLAFTLLVITWVRLCKTSMYHVMSIGQCIGIVHVVGQC